jgi:hypothetical protein
MKLLKNLKIKKKTQDSCHFAIHPPAGLSLFLFQ